jgi:2-isopropylmalate synthase
MEYIAHKKPAAMLELITQLVSKAKSLCADVEFSALDATRSEKEFLVKAVKAAVEAGATTVTLCDSVGTMLPGEVAAFIKESFEGVDMSGCTMGAEFSNTTGLGAACAISALDAGVSQIKVAVGIDTIPSLDAAAAVFRLRGEALGYESSLNHTKLTCACAQIQSMLHPEKKPNTASREMEDDFVLNKEDDIQTVASYVEKLGYEPDGEQMAQIFENFQRLSQKKAIGARELDAIIAGASLQSAPVYRLKSYVINTAILFSSSAQITLTKDHSELCGISMGDGPIDAAFVAIESIIGHHYELDDFQIRSVTEGREAMGEAIVKLRHGGKLYSGRGLSTDIVGSSIHAYINALNKICSEEA